MKALLIIIALMLSQHLSAQKTTDKNYSSSIVKHLIISNFVGDIKVNETTGDEMSIKVKETRSKKDFSVEYKQENDYLAVFLRTPCTKPTSEIEFDEENPFNLLSQNNNHNDCKMEMDPFNDFPKLTIEIFVPKNVAIYLSTISGDINVENSKSEMRINNVMGNISLQNVYNVPEATTVNGDIDITFAKSPSNDSKFTTVNGDIEIKLDDKSDFDAEFKSMMGEMYTDFDSAEIQPSAVKKIKDKKKTVHEVGQYTHVKVGNGGINFRMETINGNAYLKTL